MPRIHVLMTIYNEAKFLPASLPALLECEDISSITIVEGAYQEVVELGKSPRSTDGTVGIAMGLIDTARTTASPDNALLLELLDRVALIQANEKSDPQQRNAGLNYIRENFTNLGDGVEDYLMIVDGDEVWEYDKIRMAKRALTRRLNQVPVDCAWVKSRTFINDFETHTWHEFPRFFRITPECLFFDDNYMNWEYAEWATTAHHTRLPIDYFHYSFMQLPEKIKLKEEMYNVRWRGNLVYDWHVENGKAVTSGDYGIFKFTGIHPPHTQEVFGL